MVTPEWASKLGGRVLSGIIWTIPSDGVETGVENFSSSPKLVCSGVEIDFGPSVYLLLLMSLSGLVMGSKSPLQVFRITMGLVLGVLNPCTDVSKIWEVFSSTVLLLGFNLLILTFDFFSHSLRLILGSTTKSSSSSNPLFNTSWMSRSSS